MLGSIRVQPQKHEYVGNAENLRQFSSVEWRVEKKIGAWWLALEKPLLILDRLCAGC